MAGIGFELRKVVGKGGLGSFIKVAFSGTMIVAGPWLLSILGITVIQRFLGFALGEASAQFMGVIVYSYAWSLILFGGFHFLYTRIVADLLYVKQEQVAAGSLLFFVVPIVFIASIISLVVCLSISPLGRYQTLFRLAAALLFVSVNVIWMFMIFISLLKWYVRILLVYAGGMGLALLLVYFLGKTLSTAGALLGFAAGHVFIAVFLGILAFSAYPPKDIRSNGKRFVEYLKKHAMLLGTGYMYYWGIWIDKVVFWFTKGQPVEGTFFWLFNSYDFTVYLANLTMIPGLIYFIIVSETDFYVRLRKFLLSLTRGTFADIQNLKHRMISHISKGLRDQSLFQGIITVGLVLLAPGLSTLISGDIIETNPFRVTLIGVFFHLLFLTLMNYHFYLEFFSHALFTCFVYLSVNFSLSLLDGMGILAIFPGFSYATAGIVASIYSYVAVRRSGKTIDRRILTRVY